MSCIMYNYDTERYEFDGREIHCGDCFEVQLDGQWLQARTEYRNDGWYLIIFNTDGSSYILTSIDDIKARW